MVLNFTNQYKSLKVIDCAGSKTVYKLRDLIHSDIIPKIPSCEPVEDAHSNLLCCCQVQPVTLTLISLDKPHAIHAHMEIEY